MSPQPVGVLLLGVGGPESPAALARFLHRRDRDAGLGSVVQRSSLVEVPLGWARARRTAARMEAHLVALGGRCPSLGFLGDLSRALAEALAARTARPWQVEPALAHGEPTMADGLGALAAAGVRRVVVLSALPQHAGAHTGTLLDELSRVLARRGRASGLETTTLDRWFDEPAYLEALAAKLEGELALWPGDRQEVDVLFAAAPAPRPAPGSGERYAQEMQATVAGVLARLAAPVRWHLAYRLPVGAGWWGARAWLGPSPEQVLGRLGRARRRHVLVMHPGQVVDDLEVLYAVDVVMRELAREAGVGELRRVPALGRDPRLAAGLAGLVVERAVARWGEQEAALSQGAGA